MDAVPSRLALTKLILIITLIELNLTKLTLTITLIKLNLTRLTMIKLTLTLTLIGMSPAVIAVDPGIVDANVLALKNVAYLPHLIESEEVQQAMRRPWSLFDTNAGKVEIENNNYILKDDAKIEASRKQTQTDEASSKQISVCVCDINEYVKETANLIANYVLPHMIGEGRSFVIMTLKLAKTPKQRSIDHAVEMATNILTQSMCCDFKVCHLNANSSNERTIVCKF